MGFREAFMLMVELQLAWKEGIPDLGVRWRWWWGNCAKFKRLEISMCFQGIVRNNIWKIRDRSKDWACVSGLGDGVCVGGRVRGACPH